MATDPRINIYISGETTPANDDDVPENLSMQVDGAQSKVLGVAEKFIADNKATFTFAPNVTAPTNTVQAAVMEALAKKLKAP